MRTLLEPWSVDHIESLIELSLTMSGQVLEHFVDELSEAKVKVLSVNMSSSVANMLSKTKLRELMGSHASIHDAFAAGVAIPLTREKPDTFAMELPSMLNFHYSDV